MSALAEVPNVRQHPGSGHCRWFTSETLDWFVWLGDHDQPLRFQLCWRDGSDGRALTWQPGGGLRYEAVDDTRKGPGHAGSALLRAPDDDYDLALILPRFAAASRAVPAPLRDFVLRQLNFDEAAQAASDTLQGLTVLVTRPLLQARGLLQALEKAGAHTRLLPLLSIRRPRDRDAAAAALRAAAGADGWIFTSANAVRPAVRSLPVEHWPPSLFAIGAATARAIAAHGRTAQTPPEHETTSEGLLNLPSLQSLHGSALAIITGEGGRDALLEPLTARGARVMQVPVYRRAIVPHDADTVRLTLDGVTSLCVTSGQALMALVSVTPPDERPALFARSVVVPGERVAAIARTLGFAGPVLTAGTVSDAGYVAALARWRANASR